MVGRILPFPLLAAVLLLTALAGGVAQGQMARDGVFASLGICSDDIESTAPCLDCALAGGLPLPEACNAAPRDVAAARVHPKDDLLVFGRPILGGGARAPPEWA